MCSSYSARSTEAAGKWTSLLSLMKLLVYVHMCWVVYILVNAVHVCVFTYVLVSVEARG